VELLKPMKTGFRSGLLPQIILELDKEKQCAQISDHTRCPYSWEVRKSDILPTTDFMTGAYFFFVQ